MERRKTKLMEEEETEETEEAEGEGEEGERIFHGLSMMLIAAVLCFCYGVEQEGCRISEEYRCRSRGRVPDNTPKCIFRRRLNTLQRRRKVYCSVITHCSLSMPRGMVFAFLLSSDILLSCIATTSKIDDDEDKEDDDDDDDDEGVADKPLTKLEQAKKKQQELMAERTKEKAAQIKAAKKRPSGRKK